MSSVYLWDECLQQKSRAIVLSFLILINSKTQNTCSSSFDGGKRNCTLSSEFSNASLVSSSECYENAAFLKANPYHLKWTIQNDQISIYAQGLSDTARILSKYFFRLNKSSTNRLLDSITMIAKYSSQVIILLITKQKCSTSPNHIFFHGSRSGYGSSFAFGTRAIRKMLHEGLLHKQ